MNNQLEPAGHTRREKPVFWRSSARLILAALVCCCLTNQQPAAQATDLIPEDHALQLPPIEDGGLMFVENHGQFAAQIRFQSWGSATEIWGVAQDGLSLTVLASTQPATPSSPSMPTWGGGIICPGGSGLAHETSTSNSVAAPAPASATLKLHFLDTNPAALLEAFQPLETRFFYYIGNDPSNWVEEAPAWAGVRYLDLYPGIDLELSASNGQLTPRLIVHPGANLSVVELQIDNAERLEISAEDLLIDTIIGTIHLPLFSLVADTSNVNFSPLSPPRVEGNIISWPFTSQEPASPGSPAAPDTPADDPTDLIYSGYVGGAQGEEAYGLTVDELGAAYLTGYTMSTAFFDPDAEGSETGFDVFVAKIFPGGTGVEYVKFLVGRNGNECAADIAVDGDHAVYLTGYTYSTDFPTTEAAYDRVKGGDYRFTDAFVTKLGSSMIYSTYLGGYRTDETTGIVVNPQGQAYITGFTDANDFPTSQNAFDRIYNAYYDVFLTLLDQNGAALLYSTYLGGTEIDYGYGIAMGADGAVTLAGETYSDDFPTTPGAFDRTFQYDPSYIRGDCFATRFSLGATTLDFSTYLGDTAEDICTALAVHSDGSTYLTGKTNSPGFPVTPGSYDTELGYMTDAFVARLKSDGSGLVYATFLGGYNIDTGAAIAVAPSGAAYVTGDAVALFPTTPDAFDTSFNGPGGVPDAFLSQISSSGDKLVYSTYLGGGDADLGTDIALDSSGLAYVTGRTFSANFPVKGSSGLSDQAFDGRLYQQTGCRWPHTNGHTAQRLPGPPPDRAWDSLASRERHHPL